MYFNEEAVRDLKSSLFTILDNANEGNTDKIYTSVAQALGIIESVKADNYIPLGRTC